MWEAHLEHGDIGPGNLMYRRKDGGVKGVLIDWDLATIRGEEGGVCDGGTQRTGTFPFASLELLESQPPRRKFRHDVESMGWTLRYNCLDHAHSDNLHLIKGWLSTDFSVSVRAASLLENGKCKIRAGGFEGLFQLSGRFLLALTQLATDLPSGSRFSSDTTSGHAVVHYRELMNNEQFNTHLEKQRPDRVELDEKQTWEICLAALNEIHGE